MSDVATQLDIDRLRADINKHGADDDRRFGEVMRELAEIGENMDGLKTARAADMGAAQAIAEMARRRGKHNTLIVSIIMLGCTVITIMIQKHWL